MNCKCYDNRFIPTYIMDNNNYKYIDNNELNYMSKCEKSCYTNYSKILTPQQFYSCINNCNQ